MADSHGHPPARKSVGVSSSDLATTPCVQLGGYVVRHVAHPPYGDDSGTATRTFAHHGVSFRCAGLHGVLRSVAHSFISSFHQHATMGHRAGCLVVSVFMHHDHRRYT